MVMGENSKSKSKSLEEMPGWLEFLFREKFFTPCLVHEGLKKNEKNMMCLDCSSSLCPDCIPPHQPHRLLQIRRYMYNDVVSVEDFEPLFNLDSIQTYINNGKNAVFIRERIQDRPIKESTRPNRPINHCRTCDRGLHQDDSLYCSLSCKVKPLLAEEGALTKHLRPRESGSLPPPPSLDLEDCQLSQDSTQDATSSGSSGPGPAPSGASFRRRARKQSNPQRSPFS